MGKDKTKDGDATTSTKTNRDHSQDQEAARDAMLAKTIAKAVARETQSIAEVFARQMEKGLCAISGLNQGESRSHPTNYP